jgi:hypothetical protein
VEHRPRWRCPVFAVAVAVLLVFLAALTLADLLPDLVPEEGFSSAG